MTWCLWGRGLAISQPSCNKLQSVTLNLKKIFCLIILLSLSLCLVTSVIAVAKTASNDRSSRSHTLFQLRISGENSLTKTALSSVLSLVDLAGSERVEKSMVNTIIIFYLIFLIYFKWNYLISNHHYRLMLIIISFSFLFFCCLCCCCLFFS